MKIDDKIKILYPYNDSREFDNRIKIHCINNGIEL